MKSFSKVEPQGIPEILQLRSYDFPPRFVDYFRDWDLLRKVDV